VGVRFALIIIRAFGTLTTFEKTGKENHPSYVCGYYGRRQGHALLAQKQGEDAKAPAGYCE
jgi:hypothetical protein